jgi:hypothetical protein
MSGKPMYARLGLEIVAAGALGTLAQAVGTSVDGANRIGLYADITGGAEALNVVAGGVRAFELGKTFVRGYVPVDFRTTLTVRPSALNDGIKITGRAGGTSGYTVDLVTLALTGNRTVSFPDANVSIGAGGGGPTFGDDVFGVYSAADSSRIFRVDCSAIGAATTRTWAVPNRSDTFAGLGSQSFTGVQSITNATASNATTNGALVVTGGERLGMTIARANCRAV